MGVEALPQPLSDDLVDRISRYLLLPFPARIDTDLLFPTPTGKLWRERNFYRDVWAPARVASGLDVRPHEMAP